MIRFAAIILLSLLPVVGMALETAIKKDMLNFWYLLPALGLPFLIAGFAKAHKKGWDKHSETFITMLFFGTLIFTVLITVWQIVAVSFQDSPDPNRSFIPGGTLIMLVIGMIIYSYNGHQLWVVPLMGVIHFLCASFLPPFTPTNAFTIPLIGLIPLIFVLSVNFKANSPAIVFFCFMLIGIELSFGIFFSDYINPAHEFNKYSWYQFGANFRVAWQTPLVVLITIMAWDRGNTQKKMGEKIREKLTESELPKIKSLRYYLRNIPRSYIAYPEEFKEVNQEMISFLDANFLPFDSGKDEAETSFCKNCLVRGESQDLGKYNVIICPKCQNYSDIEMGIKEVVGQFGDQAPYGRDGDQFFIPIWNEESMRAEIDRLILDESIDINYDWAIADWLTGVLNSPTRSKRKIVVELRGNPPISENSKRQLATIARNPETLTDR